MKEADARDKPIWREFAPAPDQPRHYDIARAVRRAQIDALEDVVGDYHEVNIAQWEQEGASLPQVFTVAAIALCREQRKRLQDDETPPQFASRETLTATVEGLLADAPRFSQAGERAAAFGFFAEQAVLDELATALPQVVMPGDFPAYLRSGHGRTSPRVVPI